MKMHDAAQKNRKIPILFIKMDLDIRLKFP